MDPPRHIGRQAARGHDTVDVRMMLEALAASRPVLQPRAARGVGRRERQRIQGTGDRLQMFLRERRYVEMVVGA